MENTKFVEDCKALKLGNTIKLDSLSFEELFNLKYPAEKKDDPRWIFFWDDFEIYAKTKKDFQMSVWNGHGANPEYTKHVCVTGSSVRIWMASRIGDIGITDNLENPKGYDCRGVDNDDLKDWEIKKIRNNWF